MNLYLRLIWTLLSARWRSRLQPLERCRTPFFTSLFDLDIFRHMNNGRYFTLQDLARVDLMLRSGVYAVFRQRGWYPVVTGETMQFRRSLKLFQRFEIQSQVIGWTERDLVLEHRFMSRGELVAWGLVAARFLRTSGGVVAVDEVLDAAGISKGAQALPEHAAAWIAAQAAAARHVTQPESAWPQRA
jgi:acyl-CoA thioesterase FadM